MIAWTRVRGASAPLDDVPASPSQRLLPGTLVQAIIRGSYP